MAGSPQVLMVAPQPFFQSRGAPILVYLRCEALARLGCSLDLITFPLGDNRQLSRTRVKRIPTLPGIEAVPAGPSIRKLLMDFVMFFYLFFYLCSNAQQYDWIHCHEESAFFCIPLSNLFGLPLVYDHHSSMRDITRSSRYGISCIPWIMDQMEGMSLKRSTAVVCVIPALEERVRSRTNHDDVFVIPCTAPEELLADDIDSGYLSDELENWIRDDKVTLGYTGSLAEYQTIDQLFKGLALLENRDRLQLLMVGGTKQELSKYRSRIEKLGIEDVVFTVGRVSYERIPTYLSVVDGFVCPREETRNTPLKIYTYLWSGKPILAADIEGLRVLFEEDEIIWADPSPEGYCDGFKKILDVNFNEMASVMEEKFREQYNFERFVQGHRPLIEMMFHGGKHT